MVAIAALLPDEARRAHEPTEDELRRTYPSGRVGEERALGLEAAGPAECGPRPPSVPADPHRAQRRRPSAKLARKPTARRPGAAPALSLRRVRHRRLRRPAGSRPARRDDGAARAPGPR